MTERGDIEEIRRALRLLFEAGQVVELRALDVEERNRKVTVSGYFDDMEQLALKARELSGRAKGVYTTLNVLDTALLSRRANRVEVLQAKGSTTGDNHIEQRRWFAIDLDAAPVSDVSTTDEEHEAAKERARLIGDALAGQGWPRPILADSGNGAHLLYCVDLPADDGGLLKRCLEALHEQFGGDGVNVDRTVFNPARIWKVYGSLAAKGDSTADRPHRIARILEVPASIEPVDIGLLESLAATAPKAMPKNTRTASERTTFDLGSWIAEHELDVEGPEPWAGGQRWVFTVCPWNPDHTNGSAWLAQLASGALSAGCHHDGCSGRDWQDLRRLVEGDDSNGPDAGARTSRTSSQASRMVQLAEESGAELWHTPMGDGYVSISRNGHIETLSLRGKGADYWLRNLYYRDSGGQAPGAGGVSDALGVLRAQAIFEGDEHEVYVRVAGLDGVHYLDLGDPSWSVVRISTEGWEVVTNPPVRFRRPRSLRPLPVPRRGGDISILRRFVNVASDDDFRLVVTVMTAMLFPAGPYPILAVTGEQGSAKSTTTTVIKSLVDPAKPMLRAQPRDGRDLMIGANNSWVLTFDNLSGLQPWLSDALCRLATGGGFTTRELYSDDEEMLFDAERPIILNGIEDVGSRGDLVDRSVTLILPMIPERDRRDEERFWAEFEEARPDILGALLDLVVVALRQLPHVVLTGVPRMADFARRGVAVAEALGWSGEAFLATYRENRAASQASVLEGTPIAGTIRRFAAESAPWEGTATALLGHLGMLVDESTTRQRSWPRDARSLSNTLRRLAPDLRSSGVEVELDRRSGGKRRSRLIRISATGDESPPAASGASAASASGSKRADAGADAEEPASGGASDVFRFETDAADAADAGAGALSPEGDSEGLIEGEAWICPSCQQRPAVYPLRCFRCEDEEVQDE